MDIQKFSDTTPRPAPAPLGKSKRHSKGHVPKKLTLGPLNLSPTGISSFDSKDTALHPASPPLRQILLHSPLLQRSTSHWFPRRFPVTFLIILQLLILLKKVAALSPHLSIVGFQFCTFLLQPEIAIMPVSNDRMFMPPKAKQM